MLGCEDLLLHRCYETDHDARHGLYVSPGRSGVVLQPTFIRVLYIKQQRVDGGHMCCHVVFMQCHMCGGIWPFGHVAPLVTASTSAVMWHGDGPWHDARTVSQDTCPRVGEHLQDGARVYVSACSVHVCVVCVCGCVCGCGCTSGCVCVCVCLYVCCVSMCGFVVVLVQAQSSAFHRASR